jgi:hypothetical protein
VHGEDHACRDLASELVGCDADFAYLEGGMTAWVRKKLPLQPPSAESEFEGPKKKNLY